MFHPRFGFLENIFIQSFLFLQIKMFGCQTTKKVFYSTIPRLSGMKKIYNVILIIVMMKSFWFFCSTLEREKKNMETMQGMFIDVLLSLLLHDSMNTRWHPMTFDDSAVQCSGLHNCSPSQQVGRRWWVVASQSVSTGCNDIIIIGRK